MKKYRENKEARAQFRFHLHAPKGTPPRGFGKIIPERQHYHSRRKCNAVNATKTNDVVYHVEGFNQYVVRLGPPWRGMALSSSFDNVRDALRAIELCRAAHP